MKLQLQNTLSTYSDTSKETSVRQSKAGQNATGFSEEKNIQNVSQQNIVNNYFEVFDQSFSDVMIKNLILARLQPAYQLPEVHNFKALSAKANELLDFSIAI
ncbi:hypothetical protein ACFLR3_00430 [Campylobacterota bacterium]